VTSDEDKRCVFCGAATTYIYAQRVLGKTEYCVLCPECRGRGPAASSRAGAIGKYKLKRELEANKQVLRRKIQALMEHMECLGNSLDAHLLDAHLAMPTCAAPVTEVNEDEAGGTPHLHV